MAFHIQNNYGDNYEVQAGATIIAGGIEAALARKEAIDKIKKEAEETGVSFSELMNKYKDNVVDAEVVEDSETKNQFPLLSTTDKLIELREFLVSEGFVGKETTNEELLYYFGHKEYKPAELKRITWLIHKSNKQLLRELIIGLYKIQIDERLYSKTYIENIVPNVFVDTRGESLHLAKEKKVPSSESDKIMNFLATFHK